jgi:hypothetical protein
MGDASLICGRSSLSPVSEQAMPISFTIDDHSIHATVTGPNRLTEPEFREFLSDVTRQPDFRPGIDLLYDRRAVEVPPDDSFVRSALSAIHKSSGRLGGSRWAVLIGPCAALEAVRMTTLLGERSGIEARPFLSLDDAHEWLATPRIAS